MPIAVSSFVLESFDEEPPFLEDPGVQYARIRIAKTFRGDIEARSTVEMLSVRADNGGAGYVAVERISDPCTAGPGASQSCTLGRWRAKANGPGGRSSLAQGPGISPGYLVRAEFRSLMTALTSCTSITNSFDSCRLVPRRAR